MIVIESDFLRNLNSLREIIVICLKLVIQSNIMILDDDLGVRERGLRLGEGDLFFTFCFFLGSSGSSSSGSLPIPSITIEGIVVGIFTFSSSSSLECLAFL